jgi:hypothetical protein
MTDVQKQIKEEVSQVLIGIGMSWKTEIINTNKEDLDKFYFYKYDGSRTLEWNTYQFAEALDAFKRTCRTWEEHHNGYTCVVERVRDKYLMPKIKQFLADVERHNGNFSCSNQVK